MNINRIKTNFGINRQNATQNYAQTQHNNYVAPNYTYNWQNIQAIYNQAKPNMVPAYTKIGIQKTPYGDDIHLFKLANGQKVAIMKKPGTTIVKTFVKTGSMNEKDNQRGISHFIEHNLFNGSQNYKAGDVFKITNEMGAYTNASTNFAQTDYYISSSSMEEKELEKIINLQADMVLRPTFANDALEKEKGPVTSEISMVTDDSASNVSQEVIKNLFNIKSDSQHLVAGTIENINSLTRNDVVNYWQTYYTPDNMATVVVGDVDVDKTINLIAQNFNSKPVQTNKTEPILTPIQTPKRIDVISKTDNSSNIIAGFSVPKITDIKEDTALKALFLLLAGYDEARLTKNLKQINSYCSFDVERISTNENDPQYGAFYLTSTKDNTQLTMDTFYATIEQLKMYPPTQDEMTIIKNIMNKGLSSAYEESESICSTIGKNLLDNSTQNIGIQKDIINSLTVQDLMNVANKYLDLNKVSLGISHAQGTTKEEIFNNYLRSGYSNKNTNISFTGNKTLTTNDVKEYKLKDNTSLILNNTNSDICYFNWKLTSYDTVPQNKAISYVLSEILNNGSMYRDKSQYSKNANLKGISYGFDANGFSITLNADCLKENSIDTINMLKESLFAPRLTQEEFDKAKQKIATYCSSLTKDAETILISQLYPQYFADEDEILRDLEKITLDDVKKHYQDLINNASSNFVVSAPFAKNPNLETNIINTMSANNINFKDKEVALSKIYEPIKNNRIFAQAQERNQAQILKTYSFKMSGNIEDEVKFELLNTILGGTSSSRLFSDLREKQKLAYAVSSQVQSFGDTGILTCQILTTTDNKEQNEISYDNVQKSLEGFKKHTELLKNEKVTTQELENAKKVLKQNIIAECELPYSETQLLAVNANLPYGIKRIDEYFKTIDKITVEDIQIAANHVFSNNSTISIVASEDTLKNQKKYLQDEGNLYM
ncbi:MAG: insulinase family protein [Cyanobacteria bacterium SIG30]|nr:insulinase family protein [Cyanobacteria bacterium SIG30]